MDQRLKLHYKLCEILGSNNVYFQPPTSILLKYPCIIYNKKSYDNVYADDMIYCLNTVYSLTIITSNPNDDFGKQVLIQLPRTAFDRGFIIDNLYHEVYTTYLN